MNTEDLSRLRSQLQSMRSGLLAQIAAQRGGVMSRAESAAERFGHPEDSPAQVATERDLAFAVNEHETSELIAIDAALARIDDGTFGECTECGVKLPLARLNAAPDAARCIPCQEKAEAYARSHGKAA